MVAGTPSRSAAVASSPPERHEPMSPAASSSGAIPSRNRGFDRVSREATETAPRVATSASWTTPGPPAAELTSNDLHPGRAEPRATTRPRRGAVRKLSVRSLPVPPCDGSHLHGRPARGHEHAQGRGRGAAAEAADTEAKVRATGRCGAKSQHARTTLLPSRRLRGDGAVCDRREHLLRKHGRGPRGPHAACRGRDHDRRAGERSSIHVGESSRGAAGEDPTRRRHRTLRGSPRVERRTPGLATSGTARPCSRPGTPPERRAPPRQPGVPAPTSARREGRHRPELPQRSSRSSPS